MQAQPQTSFEPKSKTGLIIGIIVLVILVAVIIFLGWYFWGTLFPPAPSDDSGTPTPAGTTTTPPSPGTSTTPPPSATSTTPTPSGTTQTPTRTPQTPTSVPTGTPIGLNPSPSPLGFKNWGDVCTTPDPRCQFGCNAVTSTCNGDPTQVG